MLSVSEACKLINKEMALRGPRVREEVVARPEVMFVNPVEVLERYIDRRVDVEVSYEWATLIAPGLPQYQVHLAGGGNECRVVLLERLARMALADIGIAPLHNQTLRPFGNQMSVWHPVRVRAHSVSSEYTTRTLIDFVAVHHRCIGRAHGVRIVVRGQKLGARSGRVLYGYALELTVLGKKDVAEARRVLIVEPRAFFSDSQAAMRDTLVSALDLVSGTNTYDDPLLYESTGAQRTQLDSDNECREMS